MALLSSTPGARRHMVPGVSSCTHTLDPARPSPRVPTMSDARLSRFSSPLVRGVFFVVKLIAVGLLTLAGVFLVVMFLFGIWSGEPVSR